MSYIVLLVFLAAIAATAARRRILPSGSEIALLQSVLRISYQRSVPGRRQRRRFVSACCGLLAVAGLAACPVSQAQTAHFSGALSFVGSGLSQINGVAVDASGNVYIADSGNRRVLKETLSSGTYIQSVVADASTLGRVDGIAVDASGNLFLADYGAARVLKETLSGGTYTQSTVPTSGLNGVSEVALDNSGNLYIADSQNNRVLKETVSGSGYVESTVAGPSSLSYPIGLAIDASGSVLIADFHHNRILKEVPSASGYSESVLIATGLNQPCRIALDASGSLYIADYGDGLLLKETLSGSTYSQSTVASDPQSLPTGVALDPSGNLYIAITNQNLVAKLQTSGVDFGTVPVGSTSNVFSLLFTSDSAGTLGGVTVTTQGAKGLDFAAPSQGTCAAGQTFTAGESCIVYVTFTPTLPGTRYGAAVLQDSSGNPIATGYVEGIGSGPQVSFSPSVQSTLIGGLNNPRAIIASSGGTVYIADTDNNRVLSLVPGSGAPSVLPTSSLHFPLGVAVGGDGSVYIGDTYNSRILRETPFNGGFRESTVVSLGLDYPEGVAVDSQGNVYVVDAGSGRVLKESFAGGAYTQTVIPTSGLNNPRTVAIDGSGNLFIADLGNNRVVEEALVSGAYTQTVIPTSALQNPMGVSVDGSGNLYIADSSNSRVLEERRVGAGYVESTIESGLGEVDGVTVDGTGNVYISNVAHTEVVKLDYADAPSLSFAATPVGAKTSAQTVTLGNIGNAPLAFPVPASGSNPAISTNFTVDNSAANACPQTTAGEPNAPSLAAGSSCTLGIRFAPTTTGSLQGDVVIGDTNLNNSGALQSISLTGTGSVAPASLTLSAPTSATYGTQVQVVASVTDTTTNSSVTGGTVAFSDQSGSFGSNPVANGSASQSYLAPSVGNFILAGAFTPPNGNISKASGKTTIQITAAPLNILANAATRTYGAPNPAFEGMITGAVNGDSFTESYTTRATPASPVAAYPIVPSAAGPNLANYTQSITSGTLTIAPATLTVAANDAKRIYGTQNPTLTGSLVGLVNGDLPAESFTTDATLGSAAGTYTITPSVLGTVALNYTQVVHKGALTILPAPLTVVVASATRPYGASNPALTGKLSATVNGDLLAASFSTDASATNAPGQYAIVPSVTGARVSSYAVDAVPGVLTIVKATTTTTLTQATGPATNTGAIVLNAQVQPATSGMATGSVRFFNGKVLLGESTLVDGTATLNTNLLQAGASNPLTAVYQGDGNFTPSASSQLPVQVSATGFSVKPANGLVNMTVQSGTPAVFPLQASPGDAGIYPGIVTFSVAGLPAGAIAAFSPATLAPESGAQTVSLTVQTSSTGPATTASVAQRLKPALGEAMLALMLLPLARARRLRKASRGMALTLLLILGGVAGGSLLTGCGVVRNGNWSGTQAGADQKPTSYTLTVTMSSGGVQRATTETLVIQP